ncbi:uncharacterized protein HMPREF1541_07770 [Cyphellophora europaea CBS 101466]|uniref:Uncharacterized protein n=1 Tax=Cyphellophora europaea (strain CBS 101466) TaxID=1220924 RepID=W2RNP2_CYPE1|nr:uncharacterized protein HMPREF1541_07770 [Cyphellophora europaea CBS 101466]ETN38146.1 hypothetical protein HMPREF1541_07770 [Cyphellophora europaea CBS 101466]
MQSELDRWQAERNRLRTFLHNQQNRQSILERQNTRLREEHSRLLEEHSRLSSRDPSEPASRISDQILSLDQEESTLSNLASAIAEVGRDSYATRGSTPDRQRLYDWAGSQDGSGSRRNHGDSHNEPPSETRDLGRARHRELERALRNYRIARNALRSDRIPGSDLGTVPTASALRAYWSEESNDEPQSSSSHRAPFALSQFVENHRRERLRSQAQQADYQALTAAQPAQPTAHQSNISDSNALKERIRNTIHYLSKLRTAPPEGGLELARFLDLDVLYQCEDSNIPNDLPLLVDSLPQPQPSSWLTPGMTWHGLQSTDREHSRPTLLSSTLRRIRQRDYIGRAMTRRGITDAQTSAAAMLTSAEAGLDLDSDRYLSSLMRDTEGRWGFNSSRDHAELPSSAADGGLVRVSPHSNPSSETSGDHWPVTVTLHSVDYDTMQVTGTMRASQIPDHRGPTTSSDSKGRSMESFFHGEIIDFRHHSLETESSSGQQGYKVGGVDVDARYWARLGPFRQAIAKQAAAHAGWERGSAGWEEKLKTGDAKYWELLRAAEREGREVERERIMMGCVGSARWLREKMGERGEWVLMRWKEKCFVDPILKSQPSSSSDNGAPTAGTTNGAGGTPRAANNESPATHQHWGLTISGFYYVALNRLTGQIDGLYYDPGSQPYQSLRMMPEGMPMVKPGVEGEAEAGVAGVADVRKGGPVGGACGGRDREREREKDRVVAVRKWFPAVEFR